MKKHLLMLFAVMMAATMSLKAQVIVIDEGFENGIQDSVWTQEFVIGEHPWAVESIEDNLSYPSSVYQGTHRAYLRNTSGETQGYVTRLVSKVMDLSPSKVYQPQLTFWYANPKWTADRDTLRVLYKTSAKAAWKQLAEYSNASANWQKVTLELPEVNENYQIAFEGTDNLGRGIVLDSIKLRSAPECTTPHDIVVLNQGAGKVNIAWSASWDAIEYELIVATAQIDPDTVANVPDSAKIVAFSGKISGLQQNYDLTLTSGEYYYVYLRSICDGENSAWNSEDPNQGQYRFRVKATKNVPYSYGFNYDYQANTVHRDLEWTWGNNTGKFNPFINQYQGEEDRAKYSKDATTAVIFSGANNTTTPIPAGQYAYVATPALEDSANANFALNQCQVRFWSTVHTYTGRTYAHSLIVGVMTDPEDITTFVAVDTVSVWGTSEFVENIVDLSSYQGNGVYVAFLSNFEKRNLFYLDDVTIEYKKAEQKVTKISVNPRDTYADITWDGKASSYQVLITNEEVSNPASPLAEAIVAQATVTDNSYKVEGLEADHSWNRPYYVYVKAGDTDWSYRYPFVTIAGEQELPLKYDMDQKDGAIYNMAIGTSNYFFPNKVGIFSNDPQMPYLNTSNYYKGNSCLYLSKDPGNDSWITLPMIDSLQNKQLSFYLSGNTTPAQAHATVGVMTNPMDINTFIPVTDFTLASNGYTMCYTNFVNYEGPNGVIAIVWGDVEGLSKNTNNYIDELTLEPLADCLPPVNMTIDATEDSVTISWDKSNATSWEFILANAAVTETQRSQTFAEIAQLSHVLFADTLTWDDALTNPKFGFDSLESATPYYIYVRTLCEEGDPTWWVNVSFKTPCPEAYPFPYKETFNKYESSAKEVVCWQFGEYGTGTGYPMTYTPSSGAQDGTMLELWSASTTHRNVVIMPAVQGNLSDMLLKFDARPYSATGTAYLWIGSMGDINDWTTFVPFDSIKIVGGNTFTKARYDLSQYTLAYNNIAFSSGLGETVTASEVLIDNVELVSNSCVEAYNVRTTDVGVDYIDLAWDGRSTNNEWTVKVMQDTVVIVADSAITGKAFHVEGLTPVTEYTFSIMPNCDSVWTEATFRTACIKLDPTKPNKEDFESITDATTSYKATSQIPCWTVGNGNPSASTSYIPYVYKSTTYASSGNNTYRAYGYSTTNSPAYIASPEIDCQHMKELAVTFNIYATTSYWWICGVMSDPTDLSTFVALDSVKGTGASVQYTYDLSEYADSIPATAKYFAWRGRYGVTDYLYLDDVSITKITCPLPKPSYSGLTAEQVRISSGLRTENEWICLVSDANAFTADQLALLNVDSLVHNDSTWQAHVVAYDTIDGRSKVITGLKEQTNYYVAVATVCEEGISSWQVISFKTPCLAVTPEALGVITFSKKDGYVSGTGAARYMPCWTTGNKSGNAGATSSYIPYVYTSSTYLHNGDSVLCVYSYSPTSATSTKYNGAYAIMPELNVEDISKYQVNFYGRAYSTATYGDELIVGVVTDPSDLNTFVVVDTVKLSHSAYEAFSISLENYQGDYLGNKGKYIMFTNECTGSVTSNYSFIASISVSAIPTCRPVKGFAVDSIGEDFAMISWSGYTEKYRLLAAEEVVADAEKATYDKWVVDTVLMKSDSVLISGLKAASYYYFYAQGICGEGDSTDISMTYAQVVTNCPEVNGYPVPYYNDFENGPSGSGNKPLCWDGVYYTMDTVSSSQTYPYVYTTASYAASKPNSVYMYSYGYWNNTDKKYTSNTKCYAVAPKVDGNLNEYMVSFYARKGGTTVAYGNLLRVGYVTDATMYGIDSTFVKIADVEVTTATQQPYQVIISDYVNNIPAGARIALLADWGIQTYATPTANTSYYGTMYIDNFKIGMPPSCFAPTLEPGNTSLNTADVKIIPAKEWNDKWQIAVVPDSVYSAAGYDAAAYLASDKVRIVTADSTLCVVDNLDHSTLYWFYGRTVCGGEDGNSAWTDLAVSARTKYYFKDSYYFGFGKEEGWEFCQGSTSTTYWVNPAIDYGYEGGSATTSYTSYYPYCMQNTTSAIYAYGPREASDPKNGVLRWQATSSYWGGYAIFPGVAEAHDRSFEFKVRCGYGSYASAKDTIGISTNYACDIEIGTIDKNKGFETYQLITTINLPVIPKVKGGLTEANDWFWTQLSLDIDSATVANKQMVLRMPKPADSNTRYIHFDDVTLGAPKGYGLVSIQKVQADATSATVTWDNLGGPWNLYVLKENGDTLASYKNLTATSQVVEGLSPKSQYKAVLVAVNAPEETKFKTSSTKEFRTPCMPVEPNINGEFVWNFNDREGWERSDVLVGGTAANTTDTCYWKPECFTVGTTYASAQTTTSVYYNWLIQRKGYSYTGAPTGNPSTTYAKYEYGRNDSPALRLYMSSSYKTSYLVLPALNCSYDTMMIEFYARQFANYAEDHPTASNHNKIISTSYLGATYGHEIIVGTVSDPNDFSTLQVLDTLYYTNTNLTSTTLVTQDPAGLRYWEKMQLPLSAAKGKYIVLFVPGDKTTLFFVDDLSIKPIGDNLFAPSHAATGEVTKTTAEFSWEVKHPTLQSVVVVLNQDGTQEVLRDSIVGTSYTATGLNPNTGYQWYMYQTNGTVNTAQTGALVFYTQCETITPAYKTGFELEDGWRILPAQTSVTYKQTMCWTYENAGTAAVGTNEYNLVNASSIYSHSGSYAAKMYAYSTTQQNYMAMPEIEDIAAYDTLQLNFYMRPTYITASTGKAYASYLGATYAKAVIVGTMTDPMDPTTFVAIDTLNYTLNPGDAVANEANDFFYEKKKVVLTGAQGKYVTFMTTLYAKGDEKKYTYNYMYIDDVWFSAIEQCEVPTELKSSEVSATEATLSWTAPEGAASYILQVSTDVTFADSAAFVFNDTVLATSQVVTGLAARTEYVWRVMTICGEELGESEFSQNNSFITARTPFFGENFADATLDGDWTFATNPALLVIDSADVELTGSNNATYGFKRITTNYGITGAHYAVPFYSNSTVTSTTYDYYWMISPMIALNETDSIHLTLDLAMTQATSGYTPAAAAATEANMEDDFTFLIIVSDDGGKTWKKENILGIWNNTLPAGSQLRDIPATAVNLRAKLNKFAGKNIKIAFYREAQTYKTPSAAIHIGNIRVAKYNDVTETASGCQYYDIEQNGFFIDGDAVTAGEHTYVRRHYATSTEANEGVADTVYTLKATIFEAPETILSDTICEGSTYTDENFTGKERAGVYRRKMQSVENCDSLVTLHLYVTPRAYAADEEVSVCPGETYTWNGVVYDRAGLYRDTTVSMAGCDSISTLVLSYFDPEDSVYDAIRVSADSLPYTYVNEQYPYVAGQAPIIIAEGTAPGHYTEQAQVQGANCTAILFLEVTVEEPQGIINLDDENAGAQKIIYQGDMYIKTNNAWYNAAGQKVNDPRK